MRSLLLCALAAAVPALEYRLPRNQTVAREDDWDIPSIIQDVRSPMSTVMPGMGMRDWGQIEFGWRMRRPYWEDAAEGHRSQTIVNMAEARARFRLTGWLSTELNCAGLVGDGERYDYDFQDLEALTCWTLYQDRYRGGTLVLGVGMPMGTGAEPPDTHITDYESPTMVGEWRMTESLGFHVFHLNAGVRWNPSCEVEPQSDIVLEDATVPAEQQQSAVAVRADGRLGWTWRVARWMRFGAEGVFTIRSTSFQETDVRWRDRELTTAGFLEFNLGRNLAIKGTFGVDPTRIDAADGAVRTASAMLLTRF